MGPALTRPKAGSGLLVGGLVPVTTGYGAVVVLGLVYALWLVWLVPESRAGLLVCGARLQGTLEVVPVHWWAELGAGLGPLLGNILSRGGCRLRVCLFVFFLRSLSAGGAGEGCVPAQLFALLSLKYPHTGACRLVGRGVAGS